jgi:hypothetical protein
MAVSEERHCLFCFKLGQFEEHVRPFDAGVPEAPVVIEDDVYACDNCHTLLEEHDAEALAHIHSQAVQRAGLNKGLTITLPPARVAELALELVTQVLEARTGSSTLLGDDSGVYS